MLPKTIVLFDGDCTLCNGFVQFLLARDARAIFCFASLQSTLGRQLLDQYAVRAENLSTLVLIHAGNAYTQSDAVLEIAGLLGLPWRLLSPLRYLPRGLRDRLYQVVASHRYHWFGRQHACWLPTPELRQRFLD